MALDTCQLVGICRRQGWLDDSIKLCLTWREQFASIQELMLIIRLQRVGRKNDPSFRVVLTDSKNGPRSGKYLEVLGSYDARKGKAQLEKDKIKHWISKGAQTSGTLHNLLVSHKIIDSKKINVLPQIKKVEPAKTEAKKEAAPAAV